MSYKHFLLGEIAVLQAGYGFPPELQGRKSGRYPFAKVGDISRVGRSDSSVITHADHYVDYEDVIKLRAKTVPPGSILFAKIGEAIRQNHRVVASREMLIDNNAMAAIPSDRVDGRFLYHFLKTVDFYALAAATTVPALRKSELEKIPVPCPPISEQRRIVTILDKADSLRTSRRQALTQLDQLRQSIFLEMFGDPKLNPMKWPTKPLKELGKVITGGTPSSSIDGMFGGTIPFVTPGDLESEAPVRRTVTEAGAQATATVRAGATFVCCIGATIGKMGKSIVRSSFNQQLNAVEWNQRLVKDDFGLAVLRFFKPTIIAWGASTTLPILKKSSFEKIEIPIPPIELQQRFCEILASTEKIRCSQKAHLDETENLFSSLQSRAFIGEL